MAGWGEGTEGEAAQSTAPTPSPVVSPHQFTVDKSLPKNMSQHEHANRVNRIVSSYLAASPEQQHQGKTWYRKAHRAAVTVANGEAPGVGNYTKAMKRGVYRQPGVTQEHVERAAGAIARLSPSMPAGMDWEHNAQAAHEVGKLSDKQADAINQDRPGARRISGNTALHHAGGHAIGHARAILQGEVTPEEDLNEKVSHKTGKTTDVRKKAGSFYRNIANPMHSPEVTVDARSAGVASGKRVGFEDVSREVGKLEGSRYKGYEGDYQEATGIINQHLAQAGKPPVLPHHVQAGSWLADKADLEKSMGTGNGGRARGAHLHAGPGGRALSHNDFPTPVGQGKTHSA